MIKPEAIASTLKNLGFSWYVGVPCSYLGPLLNFLDATPSLNYVGATSEGEALGIAAGAFLAGRKAVTMCQNSGLGNMVNPLTSLNVPFRIPSLLIVTWRGQPLIPDEPQHLHMGAVTTSLLEAMKIAWMKFPLIESEMHDSLSEAARVMDDTGIPFCLVMPKNALAQFPAVKRKRPKSLPCKHGKVKLGSTRLTRRIAIETVLSTGEPSDAIVATTGMTSRELYTIADRPNNFYVVGSMGGAAAIALGIALVQPHRRVIVFDGDGSLLMRLGTLATIGYYRPKKLIHILLDNEAYDSTGGQPTAASICNFTKMAAGANYAAALSANTVSQVKEGIETLSRHDGPSMLHVKIRPGVNSQATRPKLSPTELKSRFMSYLASDDA